MLELDLIRKHLENCISPKRYIHSVNVGITAEKLAKLYGGDVFKAGTAGLVHDCAREKDMEYLKECISAEGIVVDALTLNIKELLHGPAAVHICRKVFKIEDEEILGAVRYHTTGRENMTLLEKIIYISDFIEPSRCFDGVELIREIAFKDLDKALMLAFDSSIRYILSQNGLIHTDTILSRNYLIREIQGA